MFVSLFWVYAPISDKISCLIKKLLRFDFNNRLKRELNPLKKCFEFFFFHSEIEALFSLLICEESIEKHFAQEKCVVLGKEMIFLAKKDSNRN